jgi:nucleoside-diphosphate-sugar epimerase
MKVLISGSTGFIGENLTRYLERVGHSVVHLNRRKLDEQGSSLTWDELKQLPEDCEVVIHLAGKAHDNEGIVELNEYMAVNHDLSVHLFELFQRSKAHTFIFLSSVKAIADTVEGFLTENHQAKPRTPYGISKLEAERSLRAKKPKAGQRLFILRPCMVYGPGNKGNLNLLYHFVAKGLPYPLAAFENRRSFLSVNNLNFVIGEIIRDSNLAGDSFNLADDDSYSTNELVSLISKVLDRKVVFIHLPVKLVKIIFKCGDWLKLSINSASLKKLTENYLVSNLRIKKSLKIDSMPFALEKELESTIRSF